MLSLLRAALAVALVALVAVPAVAADKAFHRSDLDNAAIKLEAQIKHDAGTVTKTPTALGKEADTAFSKHDYRQGMVVLGQLVTVAPADSANWLRLARTILRIKPNNNRERDFLFGRANTAAYIAYQRARGTNAEAATLAVLGRTFADRRQWRAALDTMRLSLTLREQADLRRLYENSASGARLPRA